MKLFKTIVSVFIFTAVFSLFAFAESPYEGYIICFKDSGCISEAVSLMEEHAETAFLSSGESMEKVYGTENLYTTNSADLAEELYEKGLLEYAEPNYIAELLDYDCSAEPYYSYQWALSALNTAEAWKYGVYGNGTKVAVIDSGVMTSHPDLSGRILPGYSFVNDDTSNVEDTLGHGTGVCGIIAASVNGTGIAGIAHRTQIIPIQVTSTKQFTTSNLASAIYRAVNLDADVINMSLGFFVSDGSVPQTITRAVTKALDSSVIIVAAAGNSGGTDYMYPASIDGVISVANIQKNSDGSYSKASSSQYNDKVTISAPGTSVCTTYNSTQTPYVNYSGTSFSSPCVAGIAALAKSIDREITAEDFTVLLTKTAEKSLLGGAERTNEYGYGIADAGALVKKLIESGSKGGFVSPVDKTDSGKITVKIANLSQSEKTFLLTAKAQSGGRPTAFALKNKVLAPNETAEIDITELAESNGEITCCLLDAGTLRPTARVSR